MGAILDGEIMNSAEYVTALYKLVLQRRPESGALEYWSKLIDNGGDPKEVLAAFLRSEEYRQQHSGQDTSRSPRCPLGSTPDRQLVDIRVTPPNSAISAGAAVPCEVTVRNHSPYTMSSSGSTPVNLSLSLAIGTDNRQTLHVVNDGERSPDALSSSFRRHGERTYDLRRRYQNIASGQIRAGSWCWIQGFELRALEWDPRNAALCMVRVIATPEPVPVSSEAAS